MKNKDKTHCKWGHEFTEENTMVMTKTFENGVVHRGRFCRACMRRRQKAYQHRNGKVINVTYTTVKKEN